MLTYVTTGISHGFDSQQVFAFLAQLPTYIPRKDGIRRTRIVMPVALFDRGGTKRYLIEHMPLAVDDLFAQAALQSRLVGLCQLFAILSRSLRGSHHYQQTTYECWQTPRAIKQEDDLPRN